MNAFATFPLNRTTTWRLLLCCFASATVAAASADAQDSAADRARDRIAHLPEKVDHDESDMTPSLKYMEVGFGEIEVVRERYPNRKVKVERETTLDQEGNYVNHGTWKHWDTNGQLVAEGQFHMGERIGIWTRWHQRDESDSLREYPFNQFQAPFISQATFSEGMLDGDWIIFDAKQQKCCQITFKSGKRHGPATVWLPGGQTYREGVYENGLPAGDVLQRDKTGEMQKVASYVGGRRVLNKVTYFKGTRDKKTEATYLSGKFVITKPDDFWTARFAEYEPTGDEQRHGPWKTWYSNGQLQLEGYYQRDAEVGTFAWWHPNGQKAVEGTYDGGQQHGVWQWWHANGQKATQGEYSFGEQKGLWRRWKEDGQLDAQTVHSDPRPEGPTVQQAQPVDTPASESAQKFPILPWMQK